MHKLLIVSFAALGVVVAVACKKAPSPGCTALASCCAAANADSNLKDLVELSGCTTVDDDLSCQNNFESIRGAIVAKSVKDRVTKVPAACH